MADFDANDYLLPAIATEIHRISANALRFGQEQLEQSWLHAAKAKDEKRKPYAQRDWRHARAESNARERSNLATTESRILDHVLFLLLTPEAKRRHGEEALAMLERSRPDYRHTKEPTHA
jgi:hypothetical protein